MENLNNKQCECFSWVRWHDVTNREILTSNHHPDCKNRNIELEAKGHIKNLINLIEYEASMGDGIPEEFYQDYLDAKYFIWLKI